MKAVVAPFNQEKALVGAFSLIIQPVVVVEPMDRFTALIFSLHIFRVRETRRQIPGKFPEHPLQQRSSPQQQRSEYKQFIQEEEIQI